MSLDCFIMFFDVFFRTFFLGGGEILQQFEKLFLMHLLFFHFWFSNIFLTFSNTFQHFPTCSQHVHNKSQKCPNTSQHFPHFPNMFSTFFKTFQTVPKHFPNYQIVSQYFPKTYQNCTICPSQHTFFFSKVIPRILREMPTYQVLNSSNIYCTDSFSHAK